MAKRRRKPLKSPTIKIDLASDPEQDARLEHVYAQIGGIERRHKALSAKHQRRLNRIHDLQLETNELADDIAGLEAERARLYGEVCLAWGDGLEGQFTKQP